MNVLCIYEAPRFDPPQTDWLIEGGKIYEVVKTIKRHGWDYYVLAHHPGVGYEVQHFIPVSDIDEREMIREYQTEKA